MSLVDNAMELTIIMDKRTIPDGYGGYKTIYTEGAEIMVAYSFDTSTEARIAAQQGVENRYTLTTKRSINLQYHDVVKRVKDGKIFRITSSGDDNYTPNTSGLDLRQVEAEQWEIRSDE
jgi:hypothetical protein